MELRERIIDESLVMFFEQGIKSVRMDDIASAMGISKRTIYEHFEDKESLILEGLKYHTRKEKATHCALTEGTDNVLEQIFILLRHWQKDAELTSRFVLSIKRYYPSVYREFSAAMEAEGNADLRECIELGVKQGLLLDNLNLDLIRMIFKSAVDGVLFTNGTKLPEGVSVPDAFEFIVICFLRGIATEKGIKVIDNLFKK